MSAGNDRPQSIPVEFERWFREHPKEDRDGLEEVWRLSEQAVDPFPADAGRVAAMRDAVLQEVDRDGGGRVVALRRWAWLAAAVVLVAFGSWWSRVPVTYHAPAGETLGVQLSDGTEIRLNSASTLEVGRLFGLIDRSVKLEGEGFFDVESGRDPFTVSTLSGQVEVVGTRFNVRAWPTDETPRTHVWVEEGIVLVSASSQSGTSARLTAGQSATVWQDNVETSSEEAGRRSESATWISGGIAFSSTPLRDALDEVERRFNVNIETIPDSLGEQRISLYLAQVNDIGTILEVVAAAHDLDVEVSDGVYILRAR